MDRINGAGHVGHMFVTEDAASGRPPTEITDDWLNGVQEEVLGVIIDQGLVPSNADLTQLCKAIKGIFQKSAAISAAASGTVDAITANYTPAVTSLTNNLLLIVRAGGANTSTTPTFTPASATIPAKTIVKGHNQPLVAGDISGAGFRAEFQYDQTLDKWMLLNPATGVSGIGFTPVQQGTGVGQTNNAIKIGYSAGSRLKVTVDSTDLGNIVFDDNIRNGTNDPTYGDNSFSAASTNWVRGVMGTLAVAAGFSYSWGPTGYIKLPSWLGGFMANWVTGAADPADSTEPSQNLTFMQQFPNAIFGEVVNTRLASASASMDMWYQTYSPTTTGVGVQRNKTTAGTYSVATTPFVIAFGR